MVSHGVYFYLTSKELKPYSMLKIFNLNQFKLNNIIDVVPKTRYIMF